jgi:hypothetical protein
MAETTRKILHDALQLAVQWEVEAEQASQETPCAENGKRFSAARRLKQTIASMVINVQLDDRDTQKTLNVAHSILQYARREIEEARR